MKSIFLWATTLFAVYGNKIVAQSFSDSTFQKALSFKAYDLLKLPNLQQTTLNHVVTVAVIDDGFNLTHRSLKKYIYKNPKEVSGNGIDDDANGEIDDINGWDVADEDNNASLPEGRESFFYHGTMIAGAVVNVVEQCLGPSAWQYIKILPVKAIGDNWQKPTMQNGYEGIAYALKMHPDIVICAWGGGQFDKEKYQTVFEEATRQGILILSSAGNFYTERCDPPASLPQVYVVAAVDSLLRKTVSSNYGSKIDLSAPGDFVATAHPQKDNTYGYNDGSSAAVSLVGGCAAVLKALDKTATAGDIMAALKNTATPLDSLNRYYAGKLGAGLPNLTAAVSYLQNKTGRDSFFNPQRPEGDIVIDRISKRTSWTIAPSGGYSGFRFKLNGKWNAGKAPVNFYSDDSLQAAYYPTNFPVQVVTSGSNARVEFAGKKGKQPSLISYTSIPIDSSTLYCRDTRYFETPQGEISDGSGSNKYAGSCDCKWQITVPQGKRIKIEFDQFDTEAKVDFVWLFEGAATLQENVLAKFSGPDLPPVIVSGSNQVLVWFVTNRPNNGQGWHLKYTETDEQPGVKPPLKK